MPSRSLPAEAKPTTLSVSRGARERALSAWHVKFFCSVEKFDIDRSFWLERVGATELVPWEVHMTIYDELRQEYKEWRETNQLYWSNARAYAKRFAEGLRTYLGAPENFRPTGEKTQRYVEVCKVVRRGQDEILEPANVQSALTRDENGWFVFGISICLEAAENSYPKTGFGFTIGMLPKEQHCELRTAGESFTLDMASDDDRTPVYQLIRKILADVLKSEPWDVSPKRNQIGFIHSIEGE